MDLDGPVVFAYDGSDHARDAIDQAGRLLRADRNAVVLTVWQPLQTVPFFGGAGLAGVLSEVMEQAAEEAGAVAREGVELASATGFAAEPLVEEGSPIWDRIVRVADARNAALVVLGSHGRSGLSYAAMGSVATAVAHHVTRPVLITRIAADGGSP